MATVASLRIIAELHTCALKVCWSLTPERRSMIPLSGFQPQSVGITGPRVIAINVGVKPGDDLNVWCINTQSQFLVLARDTTLSRRHSMQAHYMSRSPCILQPQIVTALVQYKLLLPHSEYTHPAHTHSRRPTLHTSLPTSSVISRGPTRYSTSRRSLSWYRRKTCSSLPATKTCLTSDTTGPVSCRHVGVHPEHQGEGLVRGNDSGGETIPCL